MKKMWRRIIHISLIIIIVLGSIAQSLITYALPDGTPLKNDGGGKTQYQDENGDWHDVESEYGEGGGGSGNGGGTDSAVAEELALMRAQLEELEKTLEILGVDMKSAFATTDENVANGFNNQTLQDILITQATQNNLQAIKTLIGRSSAEVNAMIYLYGLIGTSTAKPFTNGVSAKNVLSALAMDSVSSEYYQKALDSYATTPVYKLTDNKYVQATVLDVFGGDRKEGDFLYTKSLKLDKSENPNLSDDPKELLKGFENLWNAQYDNPNEGFEYRKAFLESLRDIKFREVFVPVFYETEAETMYLSLILNDLIATTPTAVNERMVQGLRIDSYGNLISEDGFVVFNGIYNGIFNGSKGKQNYGEADADNRKLWAANKSKLYLSTPYFLNNMRPIPDTAGTSEGYMILYDFLDKTFNKTQSSEVFSSRSNILIFDKFNIDHPDLYRDMWTEGYLDYWGTYVDASTPIGIKRIYSAIRSYNTIQSYIGMDGVKNYAHNWTESTREFAPQLDMYTRSNYSTFETASTNLYSFLIGGSLAKHPYFIMSPALADGSNNDISYGPKWAYMDKSLVDLSLYTDRNKGSFILGPLNLMGYPDWNPLNDATIPWNSTIFSNDSAHSFVWGEKIGADKIEDMCAPFLSDLLNGSPYLDDGNFFVENLNTPSEIMLSILVSLDSKSSKAALNPTGVITQEDTPQSEAARNKNLLDTIAYFWNNVIPSVSNMVLSGISYIHNFCMNSNRGDIIYSNWLTETSLMTMISRVYVNIILLLFLLEFIRAFLAFCTRRRSFKSSVVFLSFFFLLSITPLLLFTGGVKLLNLTSETIFSKTANTYQSIELNKIVSDKTRRQNLDNTTVEYFLQMSGSRSTSFSSVTFGSEFKPEIMYMPDLVDSLIVFPETGSPSFSGQHFSAVNQNSYSKSIFYFFYDYFKFKYLEASPEVPDSQEYILNREDWMAKAGNTDYIYQNPYYVYGISYTEEFYKNGIYVQDLCGLSLIFDDSRFVNAILNPYDLYNNIYMQNKKINDRVVEEPDGTISFKSSPSITPDGFRPFDTKIFGSYSQMWRYQFDRQGNDKTANISIYTRYPLTELEQALQDINTEFIKKRNSFSNRDQLLDESVIIQDALLATQLFNRKFKSDDNLIFKDPVYPIHLNYDSINFETLARIYFSKDMNQLMSTHLSVLQLVRENGTIFSVIFLVISEFIMIVIGYGRFLVYVYIFILGSVVFIFQYSIRKNTRNKAYLGIISLFLSLFGLHVITLVFFEIMSAVSLNKTFDIPIIILLKTVVMGVVLFFIGKAYFKLVVFASKHAKDLGGDIIADNISAVVSKFKSLFSNTDAGVMTATSNEVSMTAAQANITAEDTDTIDILEDAEVNIDYADELDADMDEADLTSEEKDLLAGMVDADEAEVAGSDIDTADVDVSTEAEVEAGVDAVVEPDVDVSVESDTNVVNEDTTEVTAVTDGAPTDVSVSGDGVVGEVIAAAPEIVEVGGGSETGGVTEIKESSVVLEGTSGSSISSSEPITIVTEMHSVEGDTFHEGPTEVKMSSFEETSRTIVNPSDIDLFELSSTLGDSIASKIAKEVVEPEISKRVEDVSEREDK